MNVIINIIVFLLFILATIFIIAAYKTFKNITDIPYEKYIRRHTHERYKEDD